MKDMFFTMHWEIEGIPVLLQELAKKEYLRVYNLWAGKSGGFFKKVNAEYDRTFGKQDDYDNPHYNNWIAQKMNERLKDKKYFSYLLSFTADPDECFIVGHSKLHKNSSISFYMKQV